MNILEKLSPGLMNAIEGGILTALTNQNKKVEPIHSIYWLLTNTKMDTTIYSANANREEIEQKVKSSMDNLPKDFSVCKENIKISKYFGETLENGEILMNEKHESFLNVETWLKANFNETFMEYLKCL